MTGSPPRAGDRIIDVWLIGDALGVELLDGTRITVPIAGFPRLAHATSAQRANWQISGGGFGIHWPDIDEDLSVEGLLRGAPAPGTGGPAPRSR